MDHLSIRITGKVQGVFFRANAKKEAEKLGISGFAKNEPDGSVLIEAEGDRASIETFLVWCKEGPLHAAVASAEFSFSKETKGHSHFRIQ